MGCLYLQGTDFLFQGADLFFNKSILLAGLFQLSIGLIHNGGKPFFLFIGVLFSEQFPAGSSQGFMLPFQAVTIFAPRRQVFFQFTQQGLLRFNRGLQFTGLLLQGGLFSLLCLPGLFAIGQIFQEVAETIRGNLADPKRSNVLEDGSAGLLQLYGQGGALLVQPFVIEAGRLQFVPGLLQGLDRVVKDLSCLFQGSLR